MQNAKLTWYAFHFLSLRLLIGIPGQAFLVVLKISGYIGEKTNSRKRQGGPKVLMTSKGLLKKPNSHSYLWLQKWFFSALHKNFLRKLYSKRDKITCIDIAVLDANVKKCYTFSAGSGTHKWNASRRNPIWFLVTSIISRSTLELCGMQSNKADWPAEQGTTRI